MDNLSIEANSSLWQEVVDVLTFYAKRSTYSDGPCRCGKNCNSREIDYDEGDKARDVLDILRKEGLVPST